MLLVQLLDVVAASLYKFLYVMLQVTQLSYHNTLCAHLLSSIVIKHISHKVSELNGTRVVHTAAAVVFKTGT